MERINTISFVFGLKCASKSHRLYINTLLYEGRIVAAKFAAPDFGNVILLEQERLSRNLPLRLRLSIRTLFRPAAVKLMSWVDGGGGSAEGMGKSSVMNAGKLRTKSRL